PSVTSGREKGAGERNRPGDVDREYYSLQRYLALLAAGQTMAIDMLFAPDTVMVKPPSPVWRDIQAHAPRFVSRRASAFVRYCRPQANKYGIKGSRVAAARRALAPNQTAEEKHGTRPHRVRATCPRLARDRVRKPRLGVSVGGQRL